MYDTGIYRVASSLHCPSGSSSGALLVMAYRKFNGNTTPDYGVQIYIPNGDDRGTPDTMFYRTSLATSWRSWNKVMVGNGDPGRIPVYTADGLGTQSDIVDEISRAVVTMHSQLFVYSYNKTAQGGHSRPAIIFDKPGAYRIGIGPTGEDSTIRFGPCDSAADQFMDWTTNDSLQTFDFRGYLKNNGKQATIANQVSTTDPGAGGSLRYGWANFVV